MVRWEAALVARLRDAARAGVGLFLGWSLVFAIRESGIETARTVVPVGQLAVIVAAGRVLRHRRGAAAGPPGGPARRAGRDREQLTRNRAPEPAAPARTWGCGLVRSVEAVGTVRTGLLRRPCAFREGHVTFGNR